MQPETGKYFRFFFKVLFGWGILGGLWAVVLILTDTVARARGLDWSDRIFDRGWIPLIVIFIPIEIALLVLLAILPKPLRTIKAAICIQCGYDLRAHHPGDNCPECGTPIPPKSNAPVK